MSSFYVLKENAGLMVSPFFLFFKEIFACLFDDGIVFAYEFHKRCEVYVEVDAVKSSGRY